MIIKNLVTISLLVFVLIVVGILGYAVLTKPTQPITPVQAPVRTNPVNTAPLNPTPTRTGITSAQVATHNTAGNCWMIIGSGVYNVTNYIPLHPGGPGQIIPYCGKNATIAFSTLGGRGSHSQSAQNMLTNYYVGDIIK